MATALIVDDEERNREALAKMLEQFCHDVSIVGKAESVASAKDEINRTNPDIVFLDVEMPGGDGFQLLEQFNDPPFEIIFTTAHAEYAIKAIKFAALDFILKPINLNELKEAVEKAINNLSDKERSKTNKQKIETFKNNRPSYDFKFRKIAVPTINGLDFYEIADILRCEAERAYCKFYLKNGEDILISKPMKEFEDLLNECNFFRIHKSNMVNLDHITKYVKGKGGYVILSDGSHVSVSVRKKDELMEVLSSR